MSFSKNYFLCQLFLQERFKFLENTNYLRHADRIRTRKTTAWILKLTSKDLMVDWCSAICFPCIRTRLSDSVPIFSLWARTSSISVIKPLIFKCNWAFSRCKTLTLWESCVPSDCIFCIVVSRSFRKFATWLNQIQATAWEYIPYDTAQDMAGFFQKKVHHDLFITQFVITRFCI